MPVTYNLIASNTLSSSAASVTFSAIPSTYTDLVIRASTRSTRTGTVVSVGYITLNSNTSTLYSGTWLHYYFSGSLSSERDSNTADTQINYVPANDVTANTFSNNELYFPNYTAATNKPFSVYTAAENNASAPVDLNVYAGLFRSTSAITSIQLREGIAQFAAGSSFYLYGIKNS